MPHSSEEHAASIFWVKEMSKPSKDFAEASGKLDELHVENLVSNRQVQTLKEL
jgi:hypothetical protein